MRGNGVTPPLHLLRRQHEATARIDDAHKNSVVLEVEENPTVVERTARTAPKRKSVLATSSKRSTPMDPRFSNLCGAFDEKYFDQSYSFIAEKAEEEETHRRGRIKTLIHEIKRRGADRDEESGDAEDIALNMSPMYILQTELEGHKQESQRFRSARGTAAAKKIVQQARSQVLTAETRAVRDGKKSAPFFPKREDMKRRVEAARFEKLEETKQHGAGEKYLSKKRQRAPNIR